ncbi:NTPase KAP [Mesorhizobium sp. M7A.F.Ca.CA.001.07.2.1]|uniref:KAP family P-loop NTPase fold protein n=2 Tax=Phyllobacteriaceae TaxID=69277 RepID=UPI000FCC62CD|nr:MULTISPECIES: P-loop NTPase fold protein [Mesorhizobium]RUZ58749.1 NTPase KAP [Mesorhizobium sp. M7A.F.Ca.CA.004.05.2.1]RVA15116.1 NTPase KAP [Mesorhizobium sp. M7A.F.Ca.CA.002.05.1.1]MCF6121597.1 hypothetical protein [Mesorhizobium ciceri]MCQ8812176.1 P-loop NTPase fold protein [Mesorhizobium sp. SEMIA396]RUX81650.1 NTPase KAP [Mesorhizobium sp. M7A.F.Ca.CA.004.08.2.1]
MKPPTQPDSDRPLNAEAADLFGFVGIARRLAPAILKTFETDGMVVGLEGPWGSGKTTLLNFLRHELDKSKPEHIHVINIAPWLSGDRSNLVSSLLIPIADILDQIENAHAKQSRWKQLKKKGTDLGNLVRSYGAKTGRTLAPAARLAEYFIPGAKIAGDSLDLASEYLEQSERQQTTAEIKANISKRISELKIGFVVILDDLDRLEPEQAVEVVRLVRSVADFPKITYLMCYDRAALSHALMTGLKISDGDQFLQKIIQLTFTIPLPEPFDLREQFLTEALAIFEEVTGSPATSELLSDLKVGVDREGGALRTPREVKLALNSLRFLYPSIKDDVYFPDVCRLHLIKTTNPALYRWIEEYLSLRSVLVTGDGTISSHDKKEIGKRLQELLPSDDAMSTQSIWSLRRFIPGIIKNDSPEQCVFSSSSVGEVKNMIALRRLGSPIHYRYYFALTYPKTIMPDDEFNALLALATSHTSALTEKLVALARKRRSSGRSWFEHLLDRLDDDMIRSLGASRLSGLIEAISNGMDVILAEDNSPRPLSLSVSDIAERVVRGCLKQLKTLDHDAFTSAATKLASDCPSLNWLIGHFIRDELFMHGLVGERANPDGSAFDREKLTDLLNSLKTRATAQVNDGDLSKMPDLAAYLFGWRDLSGLEEPKAWVTKFTEPDEGFLFLLDKLRSWAVSDRVYYPLQQSAVSVFLDWDETTKRLETLADTEHREKVEELKVAIEQGKH